MLFDPKWEAETEPTYCGVGIAAFMSWLEQQPASKSYWFNDYQRCAVGQYCHSLGIEPPKGFSMDGDVSSQLYGIVRPMPHTYGAALERARKLTAVSL